jgi:2-polyprenyl-6-methoxyphenol hydroxylase-like FAD-dependent oxidoreductase
VLDDAADLVPSATLTVGEGNQFIAGRLRDGAIYWAADVGLAEGANAAMGDHRGFLLNVFKTWHEPIPDLIERTTNDELVIADFYDSIPRNLVVGHVAVLGDAGHPMTPDLGQGACQAIEDAVVLAECLRTIGDRKDALAQYEALRLRRVRSIVRGSRRLGRLATAKSPPAVAIRDFIARHLPASLNAQITARVASEAAFSRTLPSR